MPRSILIFPLVLTIACATPGDVRGLDDRVDGVESESIGTDATLDERLTALEARLAAQDDALATLEADAVHLLREDLVIDVGPTGDHPGLPEALAALDGVRIPAGRLVTIQIADGTYPLDATLDIAHPDGERILIVGNQADPAEVTLTWDGAGAAIWLHGGNAIGGIRGLTLLGSGVSGSVGMRVESGGSAILHDVVVIGFFDGIYASWGGTIAAPGIEVYESGQMGLRATQGGTIWAREAVVEGSGSAGVYADYGASISVAVARSRANDGAGFHASTGGSIIANQAIAEDNGGVGFYASINGTVMAHDVVATGNQEGIKAYLGGTVDAGGATASDSVGTGVVATTGSVVRAVDVVSTDNQGYGVVTSLDSLALATGAELGNNALGDGNVAATTDGNAGAIRHQP